jgi:L-ascorbate metabolism protein UlaG (beta-lactamase superfamily)
MNRRQFLFLGAATVASKVVADEVPAASRISLEDVKKAVAIIDSTSIFDYEKRKSAYDLLQQSIYSMKDYKPYCDHVAKSEGRSKDELNNLYKSYPALWWYDHAFEKVLKEFKEAKVVGNKPCIWYVYNMGVIVKTKTLSFSIDLCHRKAKEFAPYLDFALITHNHGDHQNSSYTTAMAMNAKPVISNFILMPKYYFKGSERTYEFEGIKVHVSQADHNKHLPDAVMCFEIEIGNENPFVVFHSGDSHKHTQFKPKTKSPDVFMGHCAVGLNLNKAWQSTMPAKLMLPLHHQELGHLGGRWRCVGFHEEPAKYLKSLTDLGAKTAIAAWGDRIV